MEQSKFDGRKYLFLLQMWFITIQNSWIKNVQISDKNPSACQRWILHSETNKPSIEKIKDLVLDDQETKLTIREKVWKYLISNKISNFPKPYRIPNFQEIEEASLKLSDLPVFKAAKSVEVLSDKPLASVREMVITNNKDLYVPILRSQKCFMRKLKLDEKTDIKTIVSSWGIHHIGEKVEVTGDIKFDIFILGSVAVSKDGYRIGKGGGYVDLEFAIYKEMKAITDDTIIITIVHDSQVFETLPQELFKAYDIPVDFIITPTRVITVENKLSRPTGIFWNELTGAQIRSRKILQTLKTKCEGEGRDTTLCVPNDKSIRVRRPFYWPYNRKRLSNRSASLAGIKQNQQTNQQRRRRVKFQEEKKTNNEINEDTEKVENIAQKKHKKKKRKQIDYSLRVSNINKSLRPREFKELLKEKGIKPTNITWRGYRGICFLHYAKKNYKKENDDSDAINNVIEIIQELKLNPTKPEENLNVQVMEPITRIETVDVTAV